MNPQCRFYESVATIWFLNSSKCTFEKIRVRRRLTRQVKKQLFLAQIMSHLDANLSSRNEEKDEKLSKLRSDINHILWKSRKDFARGGIYQIIRQIYVTNSWRWRIGKAFYGFLNGSSLNLCNKSVINLFQYFDRDSISHWNAISIAVNFSIFRFTRKVKTWRLWKAARSWACIGCCVVWWEWRVRDCRVSVSRWFSVEGENGNNLRFRHGWVANDTAKLWTR